MELDPKNFRPTGEYRRPKEGEYYLYGEGLTSVIKKAGSNCMRYHVHRNREFHIVEPVEQSPPVQYMAYNHGNKCMVSGEYLLGNKGPTPFQNLDSLVRYLIQCGFPPEPLVFFKYENNDITKIDLPDKYIRKEITWR